jgi:hypothetical protein
VVVGLDCAVRTVKRARQSSPETRDESHWSYPMDGNSRPETGSVILELGEDRQI